MEGKRIIYQHIQEPALVLDLCDNTSNKEMELVCRINESGENATITISGTNRVYGVPDEGRFYYVRCGEKFVQSFSMIACSDHEVIIRSGKDRYRLTDSCFSSWQNDREPIRSGLLALDHDGTAMVAGYELGVPLVYVQDDVGITSDGHIFLPKYCAHKYCSDMPLIAAVESGELCITAERKIVCRGMRTLENADAALHIMASDCGYAVQTISGKIWFSDDGTLWQLIDENATAMAFYDDYIATADATGNITVYQYREQKIERAATHAYPQKHIVEIGISEHLLAIKFLDCSFDIINWHTGETLVYQDEKNELKRILK